MRTSTSAIRTNWPSELRESRRIAQDGRAHGGLRSIHRFLNESVARQQDAGYKLAVTHRKRISHSGADRILCPVSIADSVSFPELVCTIVGVWRPGLNL